jgi:hypothetical protein
MTVQARLLLNVGCVDRRVAGSRPDGDGYVPATGVREKRRRQPWPTKSAT